MNYGVFKHYAGSQVTDRCPLDYMFNGSQVIDRGPLGYLFKQVVQWATVAPRGGGGGGTLIFSYIRRLGPFFWGQIFEFQYFLGFSEK